MKRVYIEWIDSYSVDPWQTLNQAKFATHDLCICKTIGWLVDKTKDLVVICHTYNSDSHVTGCLHIPRRCIIKMKVKK